MEQDQNLPPTPLSRKQQLEQWQAQKRMSMESSNLVKGTPVKEPLLSARLNGTPLARTSQSVTTPGSASRAALGGAPLGNNPTLVNSEANGTLSTPQADRTAKYLHNASAKPASILSPVKMGYPQRTPSKVGTPKAARVPLPAPAESSKPARVPLPRTPLPSKGFKVPSSFEQKKTKEWTPSKGAMTGPLEAIAGRVAVLKGSLTPQGKGRQVGEASHAVSKPAAASDSKGGLEATRGVGKSQPPVPDNEVESVDVEQAVHSSYWLGRIREAEVRGDHGSVITLFEQAVKFNAQPAVDLVRALQQYRAKHMGGRSAQPSSHPEQGASQASKAEGQVTRKPAPTMLETALVPTIDSTKVVNESGQNEQSGAERSVPAKGSADCERGPLVPEPGSPPAMVVLVTPVSPSERERQAKGEAQREDSPPAQEKGQDFQFYLTPICQSPANALPMVEAKDSSEGPGVDNQEQTPIESVPNAAASRFNTPDATASPESETDKTDELPVFTPFSTPIDSSPPGGSSPTILLPQDQLSLTQPQSFKASGSQTPASDLQTPRSSGNQTPKPSGYQNPKPSGLRTPVPSRLQTPRASGAQTPSESPKLFSGAQSSPQSHKRPAPVELLPAGGSPHTPRTPLFRGAPPASADVMLTPSVSPLGWQPDAGGQGPQEPGSGPGQSTPAAIQMPSVQRSASRVTPDVIRTPGLSRRLNLDADEPGRTPGRTPLSRFALKSPIGGARRVPLFDGVEKLTPAKTFTPGRIVGATGGVKEGAPEKLTPAVRIKVGGANGVNEVASEKLTPAARATPGAAVARAAGANEGAIEAVKSTSVESQAECEVTLTSTLNQITEFPVVLNGGKSLKPSPLNLSGTAKPASTPKSVSPPNVQHPEPAANASQGGDIDQSQGVGLNPTEGKQPALSGFARMVGHVATDTVAQESAKDHGASQVQSGSGAVMRGSAGKKGGPVRGGVVASGQSANGSGQGPKKGATSEVERWLRRARGQASPVTPADRTGPGITPVNQVRAPVEANLAASEEDPSGVDFPTVEDNGASADTANFTEPAPGVNTAGVNASGKESNPSVKTPHFGVRTLRNRQSPGETMGRRRGASEAGSVKTPVPGGTPLAQGVNTPKSGSKGTPMLRQERARLPHLVIDNSKRTPVSGGRPARGRRFNSLVETPPSARSSSRPEVLTPGAATAEEWAAAADQIHQDQVNVPVSPNPAAFGSPVSPVNETGSSPETPPPSDTSPEVTPNPAPLLERLNQVSPRVSKPARQLSSRFTPSRLSRAPASSTSPPVNTPDQSKTPVARLASDRGMNSGGKLLGSPAQRTPGLQGGRSVGKTGTRELRQLTGAPKLLGQGAAAAPAVTTILSPVRASKHDRQALGADRFVLSPVRRSGRKPIGEGATKQSKSEVEDLLEMTGYTYTPNKALSEPASARKTPAARRMAQLTSGGSPPELAALGDAATWQDEEDATLQHVGAEAEKNLGEEDGEEENGDMEIGGTGEEAESMDLREGREALVNKESLEDVGKTVETAELTNGVQEEHVPNVTASGGAPQDMTSAEGPPETLALEARPEETETPGQGDGVNAGGDKESLPAGPGAVAFHTKRATRRSAADAPAGKTTRKHWVVRQSLAEGLEANPRRKATGRKLAAPETDTAGQKERKSTVQEESGLIQDSAPELGADKLRENEVDVTGREGLADEGGLTIESSGERGLRRGRAGRKTVSFAAAVEAGFSDPVKEAVSGMSVGLDADNGKRVKERASHGRAGNRRKSVGAELLAVEKGTGGTAEANGGHELTTGEPAMEQSRKQAGGRKRVSFAASTNHDGGNETTDPERDPKNEGVQAAARRQSMGVTFPPPTAADVSEELPAGSPDVSEGVLAPEAVGAAASQPASEPAESGTGAKAIAKRGRGRRATAKTVAAVESESIAALALGSDIESQSVEPAAEITAEVTADTTKVKGRNARSKGAVALGAGPEGVTSAGRTRGSRAAEGAEFGGTDAKSPPKRGRGRKRAVGKVGEPVNGTGQTQNTEAGGNKHPADVTGEKVEVTLPQGPVGSSRTGRKSTAPGSEASAAQPGTGPAGKTAVGKVRRGVLEDSTNVQEGNEVRGARGRGTVKERGQGEAGPGKSVNAVESVKEPEVAVGTRVEVWWADDNRYYSGLVTEYKARSGKHKVLYDDGDSEELLLSVETWRLEKARPARRGNAARPH